MDFLSFIKRIKSVEKAPQRYFIVDPELPLDVFFGLDGFSRPTLLIEDVGKVFNAAEIPSTTDILVLSYTNKGKACLSFSLLIPNQRDVFNTLCYDLVESTRKCSKKEALLSLLNRFYSWIKLLKGVRPDVMTLNQQQGLVAELMTLLFFSKKYGFDTAVDAWVGPFMMDKDFQFQETWAEVKSCKVSSSEICISSIEQLDSNQSGSLFVYFFERLLENKDNAFSLADIVNKVRLVADSVATRTLLEKKLILASFVDNEPEYEKKQFQICGQDCYIVNETFPCLRRANVDTAITNCCYKIDLPAIENFKEIE